MRLFAALCLQEIQGDGHTDSPVIALPLRPSPVSRNADRGEVVNPTRLGQLGVGDPPDFGIVHEMFPGFREKFLSDRIAPGQPPVQPSVNLSAPTADAMYAGDSDPWTY